MALNKTILNNKGVEINYINIASFTVNTLTKKIDIVLHGYVSKEIRDIEKAFYEASAKNDKLSNELYTEYTKAEPDDKKIANLQSKIDKIIDALGNVGLNVDVFNVSIEYTENVSIADLYKEIKSLPDFKGAKEI